MNDSYVCPLCERFYMGNKAEHDCPGKDSVSWAIERLDDEYHKTRRAPLRVAADHLREYRDLLAKLNTAKH